jgi:hypothetical protein
MVAIVVGLLCDWTFGGAVVPTPLLITAMRVSLALVFPSKCTAIDTAAFLRLSRSYYQATGDAACFHYTPAFEDEQQGQGEGGESSPLSLWLRAVEAVLDVVQASRDGCCCVYCCVVLRFGVFVVCGLFVCVLSFCKWMDE